MTDLKALKVTNSTLIGYIEGKNPPYTHGNCFSVMADDNNEYKIVNFIYENLISLCNSGLTWPITVKVLGTNVAVIHDYRISHDWYLVEFCEICCPLALLPLPQLLRYKRKLLGGFIEVRNNCIIINNTRQYGKNGLLR